MTESFRASTIPTDPETTRFCAWCGQCELCMEEDEQWCQEDEGTTHLWGRKVQH